MVEQMEIQWPIHPVCWDTVCFIHQANLLTFSDCLGERKKTVREERELDKVALQQSSASNFVNILPMTRYNLSSIHLTVAGIGMENLSLQDDKNTEGNGEWDHVCDPTRWDITVVDLCHGASLKKGR